MVAERVLGGAHLMAQGGDLAPQALGRVLRLALLRRQRLAGAVARPASRL